MDQKANRISVVMCTYNGALYLKEQLDSIMNQTYPAWEVIIFDDCSTDDTSAIIQSFAQRYPSIKFRENTHRMGVQANFAAVISEAKGDYIACCDQDDVWMPFKLERLLEVVGNNKDVLVCSDAYLIDNKGQVMSNSFFKEYGFKTNLSLGEYILKDNNVTGCTMMFASSLKEKLYPFPMHYYYHDRWLGIVASVYGKIIFCEDKLIGYRQHETNVSATLGGGGHDALDQKYFWEKAKGLWFMIMNCRKLKYGTSVFIRLIKDFICACVGLSLLKSMWLRTKDT